MSDTRAWGPPLWFSLFTIASNYPERMTRSKEHQKIRKHYKEYFESYTTMLPCKYCRESYKQFLEELPIKNFLKGRKLLMYWLYNIKDKVNKKLIAQEEKNGNNDGFKTTPSPDFEDICDFYLKFRTKCSDRKKSCKLKKKISMKLINN